MEQREKLSSRLGFILISAGCAIGIGNVYRFPLVTGMYGGAIFVLFYLLFVIALGLPIMLTELAVGRASRLSIANSFDKMERPGQHWHLVKYIGISANYLIMMFYTTIASWFVIYFCKFLQASIVGEEMALPAAELFTQVVGNPTLVFSATFATIAICFIICGFGLQNGVEKVSKFMMLGLLCLLICMVIYSCNLDGAKEGLRFFLSPSFQRLSAVGLKTVVCEAMSQAFFTLSLGVGAIAVFGTYMNNNRRLLGEAIWIVALDTFVAICSGLIIFPACFTYLGGIDVSAGQVNLSFFFTTLCTVFKTMERGLLVGTSFFLFMIFASFSTVLAIFENITSFWLEKTKLSRKQIVCINIILVTILSLPAIFSSNILKNVLPLGMDFITLEDQIISCLLFPFGSLIYVMFCVTRYGWGFENFLAEVNTGQMGINLPRWIRPYMTFVLPFLITYILLSALSLL